MALQFTPIALGVMLVVAVGTLAYGLWNTNRQHQHSYGSQNSSFDYQPGYDTNKWIDQSDSERRKRKRVEHCSICLDELKTNLETLTCQHVFHAKCIQVWLFSHQTCPICRKNSNTH